MLFIFFALLFVNLSGVPISAQDEDKASAGSESRIQELIGKLGAEKYEDREEAFEALKAMGEAAKPDLKKALDSEDAEIRWRASRLLSELEGRKVMRLDTDGTEDGRDEDLSLFRDRFDEFKRLPGLRFGPLTEDFFKNHERFFEGPFGNLFEELLEDLPPMDPDAPGGFPGYSFRFFDDDELLDTESLMERLRGLDQGLNIQLDGQRLSFLTKRSDEKGEEECRFEILEDGSVKAKVRKILEDGETEESVYESKSLEAFKKDHPEIAEKFKLDGFRFGLDLPDLPGRKLGFGNPPPRGERSWKPLLRLEQRKTLGVYINPEGPDPVLRAQLGLKNNEGIIIDKVLPGSFAAGLGLESFDIILAIDDESVGSARDVGRILDQVDDGDEVKVTIFRAGEKKVLTGKYTTGAPRKV
jgi:hypothetical protein